MFISHPWNATCRRRFISSIRQTFVTTAQKSQGSKRKWRWITYKPMQRCSSIFQSQWSDHVTAAAALMPRVRLSIGSRSITNVSTDRVVNLGDADRCQWRCPCDCLIRNIRLYAESKVQNQKCLRVLSVPAESDDCAYLKHLTCVRTRSRNDDSYAGHWWVIWFSD